MSLFFKAHKVTVGSTEYGGIYTQLQRHHRLDPNMPSLRVQDIKYITFSCSEKKKNKAIFIYIYALATVFILDLFEYMLQYLIIFILDLFEYLLQYLIIFISKVILCILQFPMFPISNLFSCCGFFHAFYNWHLQMLCTMRPTG